MRFFSAKTANFSSDAVQWNGGAGTFSAWGTWNGATVSLEWSPDGGTTWIAVGSASTFTENGLAKFSLGVGHIRATLSNAGGTTSLSASA